MFTIEEIASQLKSLGIIVHVVDDKVKFEYTNDIIIKDNLIHFYECDYENSIVFNSISSLIHYVMEGYVDI